MSSPNEMKGKTTPDPCGHPRGRGMMAVRAVLCIAVAAAHVSAVMILRSSQASQTYTSSDVGRFYLPVAENLLAGNGLTDAEGGFAVRYPPGQPAFLAALLGVSRALSVDSSLVFIAANGILAGASVWLITEIGTGLAGAAAGLLAGALFGLHPLTIWLSREPLSEAPFTFLVLLGACILLPPCRKGRAVVRGLLGGLALGAAALFRPAGLAAVPWILGMCWIGRRDRDRKRLLSAALLAFAVTVAPWILYASVREGSFVLLSTGGRLSHLDGMKRFPGTAAGDAFITIERDIIKGRTGVPAAHWHILTQAPLSYLGLWTAKAGRAWYATDEGWGQNLTLLCVIPIALLGTAGFVRLKTKATAFARWSLGWLLLLVWAMTMLVLTIVRYMVPVLWIPCIFAAALVLPGRRGGWVGGQDDTPQPGRNGGHRPGAGLPRWVELTIALACLAVLSPLMALIAAVLRLGGSGSVIFAQDRVGLGGAVFRLLKFRTMRPDPDAERHGFEPGHTARVTRFGRVLRRWKLDELPQLWNVVRGEMSLVGPRPEIPRLVALYTPEQREVLRVRPGITDPASVRFRDEENLLAAQRDPARYYREVLMPLKLRINLDYLARRSPWTDLKVLARTAGAALAPFRPAGVDPVTESRHA